MRSPAVAEVQLGRPLAEVETPVLVLDLDLLEQNVARMARWVNGKVGLRPHAKIHKCTEVARRQLAAGAVGITVATAWEAVALLEDLPQAEVLIANEIVDRGRLALLADKARQARLLVAVDSAEGIRRLAAAVAARGAEIGVLVDIDVGMDRGGARSIDEARALAGQVAETDGLELRGVMGYEGHVVLEPDVATRERLAAEAMDSLAEYVGALRDDGFEIEIVSAGGTNTYAATGSHPAVTELQAGTYALMDTAYESFAPAFTPAVSVIASIVSMHASRIVLDCGTKVLAATPLAPPRVEDGSVMIEELHEEHALARYGGQGQPPKVGDRVRVLAGYAGGTTNLHDAYLVSQDQRVIDIWPIRARGPGSGERSRLDRALQNLMVDRQRGDRHGRKG